MEDKRGTYGHETMSQIAAIERNLSQEWEGQEVLRGSLHSSFEKVMNYLFTVGKEKRMLTIMCEGVHLLPDSVILRKEDFSLFKGQEEQEAEKAFDSIRIKDIEIALGKNLSCSLFHLDCAHFQEESFRQKKNRIDAFIEQSERKSDFTRLPKRYDEFLDDFIEAIYSQNAESMLAAFLKLAGAGRGLTPAADDAVVGALAGYLLQVNLEKNTAAYQAQMESLRSCLEGEHLTTQVSVKYLKCACQGAFSQDLRRVVLVLSGGQGENLDALLENIGRTGHSSGMDMLYGLQKSLKYIS